MGDASLPSAQADLQRDDTHVIQDTSANFLREVNVLVTGFGSFKSFSTNPSYLIASHLSRHLNPESQAASSALQYLSPTEQYPIRDPDPRAYKVNVHTYPTPVRVAYDAVREIIPPVVSDARDVIAFRFPDVPEDFVKPENGFDYVLHIGMAAGRENYTLETIAHRDHYKLKDVDDLDGSKGEAQWKEMELPEALDVGWNKEDVLSRWEALTRQREDEYEQEEMAGAGWKEDSGMTLVETARMRSQVFLGKGKRAVVKLSRDAGRYLCEFIFYTSLGTRWREGRDARSSRATEKVGKVAFLHVPGGTQKHDIARGVRVAESAILALVGSWEDGFRNGDVYGGEKKKSNAGGPVGVASAMYESRGTGDR